MNTCTYWYVEDTALVHYRVPLDVKGGKVGWGWVVVG